MGRDNKKQNIVSPVGGDVSAHAQKLSRSFEGRQLLEAAAKLEPGDLKAIADFAQAAARGTW